MSQERTLKKSLFPAVLACAFALSAPQARAADPTPEPAKAAQPAAASPAARALAARLIASSGLRVPLDAVVPNLLTELELHVTQSRPDTKGAIHDVVFALASEFGKTEQGVLDAMGDSLTSHMSEQDLAAAVAFLESPAGKSFLAAQPPMLQEMSKSARAWQEKLSVDMFVRAREEMKKLGFDI